MTAHWQHGYNFSRVDVIHRNCIRSEVADIETGIVSGNHASIGMGSNQVAAADLIGSSFDDGDIVRIEVAHHDLAAVGLEREMHRSLPHIEESEQFVTLQVNRSHLP